jgi:hypothetical protein
VTPGSSGRFGDPGGVVVVVAEHPGDHRGRGLEDELADCRCAYLPGREAEVAEPGCQGFRGHGLSGPAAGEEPSGIGVGRGLGDRPLEGLAVAEQHHDVALVDTTGQLIAKARIPDDAAGYRQLLDPLAEHGDTEAEPIPVAIETSRGLLVPVLRTGTRQIYAIKPLAASRHRDRHGVSRKKSDPGDALVLANILRTDMHAHRPLPADSELVRAVAVLARAQQDAVWHRQQAGNQLRSLLREYYPTALNAFTTGRKGGLAHPEARAMRLRLPPPSRQSSRSPRSGRL